MAQLMEEKIKNLAVCPACEAKYRFSPDFSGKIAVCKKCGNKFTLICQTVQVQDTPNLYPPNGSPDKEATMEKGEEERRVPNGLEITVSEDNLTAFLSVPRNSPISISLGDIKELLVSKGICNGILKEEEIEQYLKDPHQIEPLEIAHGIKSTAGQDSKITYYFDTDPLKIGTLKQSGVMDFRDRGQVPQVKKGALLARKEPALPGEPGMDVFGAKIPAPKPRDIKLRCGKGTEKSEDGLTVRAAQDGSPMLSADQKVTVFPKLRISGDVDLKTGHVLFDGDIDVEGSVKDGFRVEGGRLSAGEVLSADVIMSGDITVSGGIIGATIRGDGNLKARYIHDAQIYVLGDVVVEKEVLGTEIVNSGSFLMETGRVLNSRISSKKGIEANQIGSDESGPCSLTVGIDEGAKAKIENLKEQKSKKEEKSRKIDRIIQNFRTLSNTMQKEIIELAQVPDRGMLEQKELKEKMERIRKTDNKEEMTLLRQKIEGLEKKIRAADMRLGKLMNQQEKIKAKIEELEKKVEELAAEQKSIDEDIEDIYSWAQSEGGSPVVKVRGTIFSRTTIKGPQTTIELKKNFNSCTIREKQVFKSAPQEATWKMVASPLL